MNSIRFFDDRYPVKTVYTVNEDWRNATDWRNSDARNEALQDYLGAPLKQFMYASETHSGNVLAVWDENRMSLEKTAEENILGPAGGHDAMVTATPGILLCIWSSDCLPLFLYDPKQHVAAIAHCGWRGVHNGIVPNTLHVMAECFQANPEDVIAAFGPCICAKCYEVSQDLVETFSGRLPTDEIAAIFAPTGNGKYQMDLRKAVSAELFRTGIRPANVFDVGICSYESENYPSYRRNGSAHVSELTLSGIAITE